MRSKLNPSSNHQPATAAVERGIPGDANGVCGCVGRGEATDGGTGRSHVLVALGRRLLRAGAADPRAQGRRVSRLR